MKLELLHKEKMRLAMRITGINASYINTLRRYMSSRVPTMAIDFVEFKTNNSILYDEMVAHRLGLIPLTTDLKGYKLPKEEWNEPTGDPRVECQLILKVPKVKGTTTVTAEDLKSKDAKISAVHENMPIVKLIEGQEISLVATARLGLGEEHTKWSPGHVWYRPFPHIKIKKQPKNAEELAKHYPKLFTYKGGKLSLQKEAAYHFPDKELGVAEIEVTYEPEDYILEIESWGQLDPKTIVKQALTEYDNQLDEFNKLTKEVS